jgi:hypothetical protein
MFKRRVKETAEGRKGDGRRQARASSECGEKARDPGYRQSPERLRDFA